MRNAIFTPPLSASSDWPTKISVAMTMRNAPRKSSRLACCSASQPGPSLLGAAGRAGGAGGVGDAAAAGVAGADGSASSPAALR